MYPTLMVKNNLAIEAIFVASAATNAVHTERYLYSLSDTEWTELRAKATRSRSSGIPLLRCGDCNGPVYARESRAGRRHCYHFGTETKKCRWSSANAQNLRAIDADKFGGRQEGERHKILKNMICEILALDPISARDGISPERYTKGADGQYTFPDVFAVSWQGGPAAFEIQLATTQLPTIIRREDFYETNGIRLCWIVDNVKTQLDRRTFKDIYLRNNGQIFGVDSKVVEAARAAGAPRFRLYRLLPDSISNGFKPIWKNKIVTVKEINWGNPGAKPQSAKGGFDAYFNTLIERDDSLQFARRRFQSALKECDHTAAGEVWDTIVAKVGGQKWQKLGDEHETVRALGVLATVQSQEICIKTKIGLDKLPHLINSMLLEPRKRRRWTHAFQLIAKIIRPDLLLITSIKQKCDRNRTEQADSKPADLAAGQAFNVFFPEGAFQRLQFPTNTSATQVNCP